jgi:hypothetical protein
VEARREGRGGQILHERTSFGECRLGLIEAK